MSFKEWKTYRLCEIPLEIIDGDRGKNYPKQDEFSSNGYCLFLNTGNVSLNGFNFSKTQFITKSKDTVLNKGKLKRDDVVLTTRGTLGNIGYFSSEIPFDNIRINSGMVILRNRDENELNTKYLYQYLKSSLFKDQVISFSSGSAQPQLPIKDLREIEITLPTVKIQQNIASILSSLDDKIELNRQTNQTLEGIAQTLFQEMCVPKGEELPEEWRKCIISNLFEVKDGTHDSPKQKLEGKYLITSKHLLKDGTIDFNSAYKISVEDFNEINKRSKVDNFDILYSMIGTIGNTLLVNEDIVDFSIKNMGLFKTSQKQDLASFIYLFLKSEFAIQYMKERYSGSTQQYVTLKTLREIPINLPNQKTITEFNKIAVPVFEQIKNNIQENQTLIALRDSLLPKLMKGEIEIEI